MQVESRVWGLGEGQGISKEVLASEMTDSPLTPCSAWDLAVHTPWLCLGHHILLAQPLTLSSPSLLTGLSTTMLSCWWTSFCFPPFPFPLPCSQHCQVLLFSWGCGMTASKGTKQIREDTDGSTMCYWWVLLYFVPSGSDQGPSISWRSLRDLQELELGAFPSDLLPLGFLLWLRFERCPCAGWGQVVPQPTNGHVNPIMAFPTDFCSPAPSPSQFLWQLLPPAESSLQG